MKSFRPVLLVAGLMLLCGAVVAQPSARAPVALNIEAQPMEDALNQFAQQTGLQLLISSEDVTRGIEAPSVVGSFTPEAALQRLLADSKLRYEFVNDRTVAIRAAKSAAQRRPEVSSLGGRKAGAEALRLARVEDPARGMRATRTADEAAESEVGSRMYSWRTAPGNGEVTGSVTDVTTGANLKGAKVLIEETGQVAVTDDLGQFRLVGVKPGAYTLKVSYLGYAELSVKIVLQRGENVVVDLSLNGAGELVVYGSRSARAQALNQERTAENSSTVISADLLGQFDGTMISESLRRMPGVAFQADTETGDGANIIIRGLGPDLNMVTMNGLRLPVGNGIDRSPMLNNILTESISRITISKTLLPNQDSSGTGGLVDIETKGPLDRPSRYASFSLESATSDRDFLEEYIASGTVARRYGAEEEFGLSASVQYRERNVSQITYGLSNLTYGQYLPLDESGNPITSTSYIDPRRVFPYETGVDVTCRWSRKPGWQYQRRRTSLAVFAAVSLRWRTLSGANDRILP